MSGADSVGGADSIEGGGIARLPIIGSGAGGLVKSGSMVEVEVTAHLLDLDAIAAEAAKGAQGGGKGAAAQTQGLGKTTVEEKRSTGGILLP